MTAKIDRSQYRVITEQETPEHYKIRVEAPNGGFAQWWIYPAPYGRAYWLCSRPEPSAVIHTYKEFPAACRAANLRARSWLGSHWGLKGPAKRFP